MAFDGFTLAAALAEVQDLEGGKIQKIQETEQSGEFVLSIYQAPKVARLLISTDPKAARLHLTKRRFRHPRAPSHFCMTLRKHLQGTVLRRARQVGLDRVAILSVDAFDDLGHQRKLSLIAETMDRFSNLILIANDDDDKILAAERFAPPGRNAFRSVLPGHPYHLPPQKDTVHPAEVNRDVLKSADSDMPAWRWIVQHIAGPGPDLAHQLLEQVGVTPTDPLPTEDDILERLTARFHDFGRRLAEKGWCPWITYTRARNGRLALPYPSAFGVFPTVEGPKRTFRRVSTMLDAYFALMEKHREFENLQQDLRRQLKQQEKGIDRRLHKQKRDFARTRQAEKFRRFGELLTTFMHQIPGKATSVTLPDYYQENKPVEIPLDPRRSPSNNAAHYFHEYRRMQRTMIKARRQIQRSRRALRYVQSLLHQLDQAETLEELKETQEEAEAEGLLRKSKTNGRARPAKSASRPRYRTRRLANGLTLNIGRNNRSNDYLTMKRAKDDDLWFHVKDLPGSHVILPGPWSEANWPDAKTLEEAAQWAAYYSAAHQSANVPVDYTKVKHVTKPKGAKPGMVNYRHHKTLYVTPPNRV